MEQHRIEFVSSLYNKKAMGIEAHSFFVVGKKQESVFPALFYDKMKSLIYRLLLFLQI